MKTTNKHLLYVGTFLLGALLGAFIATHAIRSKIQKDELVESLSDNTQKSNHNAPYNGIDVSNHQGDIDWEQVATDSNIAFVYIKSTEGATYVDKLYAKNIAGARANGIKVGSYHYLRNTSSIEAQFANFTATVDRDLQDLVPMVDVEEKVDKDSIRLFCNLIKQTYGKAPMIYGTNRSYNSFCAPDFNQYHLMIG